MVFDPRFTQNVAEVAVLHGVETQDSSQESKVVPHALSRQKRTLPRPDASEEVYKDGLNITSCWKLADVAGVWSLVRVTGT
jgi:hypothetical protein